MSKRPAKKAVLATPVPKRIIIAPNQPFQIEGNWTLLELLSTLEGIYSQVKSQAESVLSGVSLTVKNNNEAQTKKLPDNVRPESLNRAKPAAPAAETGVAEAANGSHDNQA